MKKYDCIVIGSGSGLDIASFAHRRGLSVAIVEEGPMGGTCLNRGCIPSKMLIHCADVAETIRGSKKFGIKSRIEKIDFAAIVKRVSRIVDADAAKIEKAIRNTNGMTLYKARGKFVSEKTMEVGGETISADKVFIVGGTRSVVPPIPGLDTIPYLTSTEALRVAKQPKSMIIVGGGYIAVELAHFYGALGTDVTLLVREERLVDREDTEISSWFSKEFAKKYTVMFKTEIASVARRGKQSVVALKDSKKSVAADQVLVAVGRIPNTDILNVAATGVGMNARGYITVNGSLETNVPGIWALGDIAGILPFKHTANLQAEHAVRHAFSGETKPLDYHAIPHAIFSSPQVAGVGKTEEELKKEGVPYKAGRYEYKHTGMGAALQENGLVKILAGVDGTILGCHIVGPDASSIIHEVVVAMNTTGNVSAITDSVHVHPALSEVVQRACHRLE